MQAAAAVSEGGMVDIGAAQRSGFSNGKYVSTRSNADTRLVLLSPKGKTYQRATWCFMNEEVLSAAWVKLSNFLMWQKNFGATEGWFRDESNDADLILVPEINGSPAAQKPSQSSWLAWTSNTNLALPSNSHKYAELMNVTVCEKRLASDSDSRSDNFGNKYHTFTVIQP